MNEIFNRTRGQENRPLVPRFRVVDISTVSQGVVVAYCVCLGAGGGDGVAPGVVAVANHFLAGAVEDGDHISLEVGDVIVEPAVHIHHHRRAGAVIGN